MGRTSFVNVVVPGAPWAPWARTGAAAASVTAAAAQAETRARMVMYISLARSPVWTGIVAREFAGQDPVLGTTLTTRETAARWPLVPMRKALTSYRSFGEGPFERTEDFTLYDRCITRGVIGSILPV